MRWWSAIVIAASSCVSRQVYPPPGGDACEAACVHRVELRCIEPAFVPRCVPVCRHATQSGLYDPARVAQAQRDDLPALGVRCLP